MIKQLQKIALLALLVTLTFQSTTAQRPVISFFNELKSDDLVKLFKDTTIIKDLKEIKGEIRMGMLDMTDERSLVVKELNKAGIPVVAWLLLPEEKGYWFHSGNGRLAVDRYNEFKSWSEKSQLHFSGIGIDLELDMNDAKLIKNDPWKLIRKLPGRLYDRSTYDSGVVIYNQLVERMIKDGYEVESYYASFIKDETAQGNTSIQQMTKFLDIKTPKEIPMLYSSFIGNPDGLFKIYGLDVNATAVGIGSTGGGVDTTLHTLNWDELKHDLITAGSFCAELHIFSLEGCVKNGFLSKIKDIQFTKDVKFDDNQVAEVRKLQRNFIRISNVLSYPTLSFAVIILSITTVGLLIFFLLRWILRLIMRKLNDG